jgi:hypothetical protein
MFSANYIEIEHVLLETVQNKPLVVEILENFAVDDILNTILEYPNEDKEILLHYIASIYNKDLRLEYFCYCRGNGFDILSLLLREIFGKTIEKNYLHIYSHDNDFLNKLSQFRSGPNHCASMIKELLSTDHIYIHPLYRDEEEVITPPLLLFLYNSDYPDQNDCGLWRRLIGIRFKTMNMKTIIPIHNTIQKNTIYYGNLFQEKLQNYTIQEWTHHNFCGTS